MTRITPNRRMFARYLAPCALLLLLAPFAASWAMPPFGGQPHGGFGGDLFFLEHMAQKLDLSDDQRKQVEAIMNQQREQARPYVKTLVETRREMRHAMKGDDFDEAAIRAIAERQARAVTEMAVLRARGRHAMQQILTPEQRQRMRHQHRERRGDGADGGAPGFDGQED